MGDNLKAGCAGHGDGFQCFGNRVPTLVELEDMVIHALDTDLELGDAHAAVGHQLFAGNQVRSGFNHQANVTMPGANVAVVDLSEGNITTVILRVFAVECLETAPHKPFLVGLGVSRPAAAQDEQLNFVGGMTHLAQRLEAGSHLAVGVKIVLHAAARAGFVGEVGLGHVLFRGAENAVTRTGAWTGEHRDGGHTGESADGLHANGCQ